MAAKKAKKFVRKTEKQYTFVSFTLSDIYGDAEFSLPESNRLPLKIGRALKRNDVNPILDFLADVGVEDDAIDAIDALDSEEFLDFMKAWGEASGVDIPK